MSDWKCEVVKIETIVKHPNANNLSIASVLGDYPVVIKTGEYSAGDLAGYISIDTIVPDTEQFHFLSPRAYEKYEENGEIKQRMIGQKYPIGSVPENKRIVKAKKFFGVYSQGLLVCLPKQGNEKGEYIKYEWSVGDPIIEFLNLKKWEEPEEENLPHVKKARGANQGPSPKGWTIPHYDIDGIRKYLACLGENEEIVLTEKIHGSNAGFSHDGEKLWSKSRNYYKKLDPDDMWWDVALRYDLETKLSRFPGMVFFGEIVGQVKGFRYDSTIEEGRLMTTVHFFDIWDIKKLRYLDYDDRVDMIKAAGLSPVPELYRGPWKGKEHAYKFAEGQSVLNPKHIREGAVLVPLKERYEPRLDSRLQLKIVGEGYNLQK